MNYYERHIGDYLKDTAHLSLLEHGVYTRLLDVYYTRESGIPAADAARLIGARSRDEKAALAAVLAEFFALRDDLHCQDRADREVERFHGKQAKAKASADARWSAQRSLSERNANASGNEDAPAMRSLCEGNAPTRTGARPSPVPSNQTPDTREETSDPGGSAVPAKPLTAKERLWALGVPLLGDGGRALLGKLAKSYGEELLAKVLAEATLERPVDPKSWVIAACEAKAKTKPVNGHAGGFSGGGKEALDYESHEPWAIKAGFEDTWAALNDGCYKHNAAEFRNGKRIGQ